VTVVNVQWFGSKALGLPQFLKSVTDGGTTAPEGVGKHQLQAKPHKVYALIMVETPRSR
jgi:hypothetical protein